MDIIKHLSVFDPFKYAGQIAVIGVGSIGSNVALHLAKLGLGNSLHLFDDDKVEAHNLPNQILYGPEDIGRSKVQAAKYAIQRLTGIYPRGDAKRIETVLPQDITTVFLCVDSMAARTQIFGKAIFLNPRVTYLCDGRMGAYEGQVTAFDARDLKKGMEFERRLYPDSDVLPDTGGCGVTLSIGATASIIANLMVWHFIKYEQLRIHQGNDYPVTKGLPYEELMLNVADLTVTSKGFLT